MTCSMSPDQKKLKYVEPQIPENTVPFNASICSFCLQTLNVTISFKCHTTLSLCDTLQKYFLFYLNNRGKHKRGLWSQRWNTILLFFLLKRKPSQTRRVDNRIRNRYTAWQYISIQERAAAAFCFHCYMIGSWVTSESFSLPLWKDHQAPQLSPKHQ